jgi:hypothetical protein
MNEPHILFPVCSAGVVAALIAFMLYFFSADDEPSGFRLFPSTRDEWIGYYFRTLILTSTLAMFLSQQPHIHPIVLSVWGASALLLVATSGVFWHSHRGLCAFALIISGISLLWLLLFPGLVVVR